MSATQSLSARRPRLSSLAVPRAAATFAAHPGFPKHRTALTAAGRCGVPNATTDALPRAADGRWVPVVRLRLDQGWMAAAVRERGIPVILHGEEDPR